MKKLFSILLIVLYAATVTGANIQSHYCMGNLVEESLWQNDNADCSKCGMEIQSSKKSGCCNHENKFVKSDNTQILPDANLQITNLSVLAFPVSFFETNATCYSSLSTQHPLSNSPPPWSATAIYKRICVFRI